MSDERAVPLVLLTRAAEADFLALPPALRKTFGDVMRGLAETAEFLEPISPSWRRLPGFRPALLRIAVGGVELLYTVDRESRTLSVQGVLVPAARPAPAHIERFEPSPEPW